MCIVAKKPSFILQVNSFFKGKDLKRNDAALQNAIRSLQSTIQWRRLNEEPLRQWLKSWKAHKSNSIRP